LHRYCEAAILPFGASPQGHSYELNDSKAQPHRRDAGSLAESYDPILCELVASIGDEG
jgi:hypothetical protein